MKLLPALLNSAQTISLERYAVDRPVDPRGEYQVELPVDFPFGIRRLSCAPKDPTPPLLWHTFLEIFVPLSRTCRVQMGRHELDLSAGDVLVMDNLRLHAVRPGPREDAHWLVIRFMPEFVLGVTPSTADRVLLMPFYYEADEPPRLVPANSSAAREIHAVLAPLLRCWMQPEISYLRQAGCRAHFTLLLYELARHFGASQHFQALYSRQRSLTSRLRKLFEHVDRNFVSPISCREAASITGLGRSRFHAVFKEATGTTLSGYLNQLRLTQAARLLKGTDRSIAEIASEVGFSDQSYFDRRFRRHYGRTPSQFRRATGV